MKTEYVWNFPSSIREPESIIKPSDIGMPLSSEERGAVSETSRESDRAS